MKVEKKDLAKSEVEILVELSAEEFKPYIERGAAIVAREIKIEGFRPGKAPYEIVKGKVGEMTILEEAAHLAIRKTIEAAIKEHAGGEPVGQPKVDIVKLAPGNPLEYKITLALLPEIKLGDYKAAKVKQKKAEFKEEEISGMIENLREMKAWEAAVSRELKSGDKATVDIEMFLDSVPVEGGQGKNTTVLMGKNYIVPGFDDKLLGARPGETREFSLPYPADHHMKNLAGKRVEFRVKVNEVFERQLPALDDFLAADFGLKTIAELRENITKSIKEQKERELSQAAEREMLLKIITASRFGDIPEMLIQHEADNMLHELEHEIADRGGKFEDYLASVKKNREQIMLDMLPDAVKRVKISLLVREIAKTEGIKVTDEEVEKQIKGMKDYYEQAAKTAPDAKDMVKRAETPEYRNYVVNVMSSRKVIDKLREWNVEK